MNSFLSAALLSSLLAAPPELPKTFDLKAVDAYIADQVKDKGFVGLSVAVMRDGKVVFAKGYGQRAIEM
jgi:CubicO group peptidase (beta-lactamase class C family)